MPSSADIFSCLGQEDRLGVVRLLIEKGPLCVGEIMEHYDRTQPNLSRALKTMKEAGVVSCAAEGQKRIYALCEGVGDLVALADRLSEKSPPR